MLPCQEGDKQERLGSLNKPQIIMNRVGFLSRNLQDK